LNENERIILKEARSKQVILVTITKPWDSRKGKKMIIQHKISEELIRKFQLKLNVFSNVRVNEENKKQTDNPG
jgi:hypothetical protein